jgi:hypothetical protein
MALCNELDDLNTQYLQTHSVWSFGGGEIENESTDAA